MARTLIALLVAEGASTVLSPDRTRSRAFSRGRLSVSDLDGARRG